MQEPLSKRLQPSAGDTLRHLNMVQGGGFEPPKLARQIYSLIPLATREPLLEAVRILYIDRRAVNIFPSNSHTYRQNLKCNNARDKNGAGERSRTPDRLITSQLLYQLSYASTVPH